VAVVNSTGDETLDWPVAHGGAAVLSADDEVFTWRGGTDEDHRFAVASVTKPLSALAALAAVEDGRLGLDDPVEPDQAPAGSTVRHLLAHASGLPFEEGRPRQPGQRRVYSNLGFRVLAKLTERAVGQSFFDWLDERVLRPLAMRSTTLEPPHADSEGPSHGAVTTLPDLALLAGCLLDHGAPVIGPELFAEAVTVQFPGLAGLVPGVGNYNPCDWGLGFELKDGKTRHWMGDARSPATFGHFGASGSFVWVDPEAGLAAAAVTDRPFNDDGWAMEAWPAWSDAAERSIQRS
jgi:CubicO group peptidase (beta-lactamase class C family)